MVVRENAKEGAAAAGVALPGAVSEKVVSGFSSLIEDAAAEDRLHVALEEVDVLVQRVLAPLEDPEVLVELVRREQPAVDADGGAVRSAAD